VKAKGSIFQLKKSNIVKATKTHHALFSRTWIYGLDNIMSVMFICINRHISDPTTNSETSV